MRGSQHACYLIKTIEVGAEPVLVVETRVRTPLAGVILYPEIELDV